MVGLLSPDIVFALRSLRDSYTRHRQSAGGPRDAHAKAALDRLIAAVDGALASGEAPVANIGASLRSSAKFLSRPVAPLSRGEMVKLLAVGDAAVGGSKQDWWQAQTGLGVKGWIHRKEIFPDGPAVLSSQPGAAGQGGQPDEIELGVRDTMIR